MRDDMVSRKAVMDELVKEYNRKAVGKGLALAWIEKAVNTPDGWIPVSERLPEQSGKYLVTVSNGNVYAGTFSAYEKRFSCAAVAWMPLPEPYEEDEA